MVARAVVPGDEEARWLVEERATIVVEPERPGPRLVPVPSPVEDVDEVFDQEAEPEPEPRHHHTVVVEHVEPDPEPEPAPERPRPVRAPAATGRGKRPVVPSWDEILFGTKKSD